MNKYIIVAVFLLFFAAPTNAAEKIFNAKSYRLDNGLQIVVVENHRAPVVTHMIWYRVGAADEPRGKSGIAHFLEHLMFKGHKHSKLGDLEAGEFSKIVRALGGNDNAFTSQDYTAYYQSIASEHLEKVMTMEAGRMRGMNIPTGGFASENKVIKEERRQRTDNNPRTQMTEQMNEVLFTNHPYALPIVGWMHEVQALSQKDVMDFYNLYYAPNNAILVVSGDVTGDEVYEIAKRTYGILKPANTPERMRTTSPPFIASTSVTLEHKNIKEPTFLKTYRVPSHRQNPQQSLALEVLENIIGNGSTSRLYKSLVIDKKLATNISVYYNSAAWNDAKLSISANPKSIDEIDDLQEELDNELRNIIINITDTELNNAIERMQAEAIYARDSLSGPAMVIGSALITGSSLDDIEYWARNIKTVTKEQIQDVANIYLNPDKPYITPPVIGILRNKAEKEGGE